MEGSHRSPQGAATLGSMSRMLSVGLLATTSSVLAAAIWGSLFTLPVAVLLVWPAAALQRRQWPMLQDAPHWVSYSVVAAMAGGMVGLSVANWYGGGHVLRSDIWFFQNGVMGFAMGLSVGLAQLFCMQGRVGRPWPWLVLTTLAYTVGGSVVDQPGITRLAYPAGGSIAHPGGLIGLEFLLSYALVVAILGVQSMVYPSEARTSGHS